MPALRAGVVVGDLHGGDADDADRDDDEREAAPASVTAEDQPSAMLRATPYSSPDMMVLFSSSSSSESARQRISGLPRRLSRRRASPARHSSRRSTRGSAATAALHGPRGADRAAALLPRVPPVLGVQYPFGLSAPRRPAAPRFCIPTSADRPAPGTRLLLPKPGEQAGGPAELGSLTRSALPWATVQTQSGGKGGRRGT